MTGIGSVKMVKSVTKLTPAIMYQIVGASRHFPFAFAEGSQNAATGWQMSVSRNARATAHAVRKMSPKRQMRCMMGLAKRRLYCRRMEILVRQTAMLYTTMDA